MGNSVVVDAARSPISRRDCWLFGLNAAEPLAAMATGAIGESI